MDNTTILAVREAGSLLAINKKIYKHIELLNFPIVKDRESYLANPYALLHAMGASPAVYVEHSLQKVEKMIDGSYFLLNPLSHLSDDTWDSLLQRLHEIDKHTITLIASASDLPIGLYIPKDMILSFSGRYILRYLSFVSATIDFALLQSFFNSAKITLLCQGDTFSDNTAFLTDPANLTIYKLMTSHYLRARATRQKDDDLQHIVVMPYHAGDVLFLCYALKESKHPFTTMMVNSCYVEIAQRILPEMAVISINADPIKRGSNVSNTRHKNIENLYFLDTVYPEIPANSAFQYLRPSRDCDVAKFHFMDQWKSSISNQDYPLINKTLSDSMTWAQLSKNNRNIDKSIFMHLDAGWALKIYPLAYQKMLISLLKDAGYRITVLTDKNTSIDGVNSIQYTTINVLEEMITSHAIFLGMDSYPGHFATHILKHPSITLFSSTNPDNADAPNGIAHKDLHNSLSCCPCRAQNVCPKYNLNFCKNFTSPRNVMDAIEEMYANIYLRELEDNCGAA